MNSHSPSLSRHSRTSGNPFQHLTAFTAFSLRYTYPRQGIPDFLIAD